MITNELPKGWEKCRLPEFTRIVMGQSPPSNTYNLNKAGLPFFQGKAEFTELHPEVRKYCSAPSKIAEIGATLLTVRAPVGPTNLADQKCCIGRGLAAIHPEDGIPSRFVFFYFRSIEHAISGKGTGTTFSAINGKFLDDLTAILPPLAEQRRIVAKIEELFSELDKGIENLKLAQAQLTVYRQALLKHAFEGKLTAAWRAKQLKAKNSKLETGNELLARIRVEREARYKKQLADWKLAVESWETAGEKGRKPTKPREPKELKSLADNVRENLAELPALWAWDVLGWMTNGVEYGSAAKSSESGTHVVLRMGNLQNSKIDWNDLAFSSEADEIAQYLLHPGDVLFNRTNSPEWVGKTAIYKGERPALFAGYLIRVNHSTTVVRSDYLNWFLNSPVAKQYGNTVKTDGVNQSNINGEKLAHYPFPYCSLAEQGEIVRILEETMSLIDRTVEDNETNLQKGEALRQSILKKAFAGGLVPQDPADEPAAALLARIRAERESAASTQAAAKKPKTGRARHSACAELTKPSVTRSKKSKL